MLQPCESIGSLHAYADDELAPGDRDRVERHLGRCERCQRALATLRADSAAVTSALAVVAPTGSADPTRALAAFRTRLAEDPSASDRSERRIPAMFLARLSSWQRAAAAAAVAVLLVAGLAMTPSGQGFAQGVLQLFRVQRLTVVTFDPQQPMKGLIDLSRLGEVSGADSPATRPRDVASAAEASRVAGFEVRPPARLPAGFANPPKFQAWSSGTVTFTFRQDRARAYLNSIGETKFSLPAKFDGARLVMTVPSGVLMLYSGARGDAAGAKATDRGPAGLIVGQARSPTAEVQGNVTLAELRDFLLSIPGLPADTVAQLRAIDDWTTTLPIPVARDRTLWHDVAVDGARGLALADNTGLFGAVIWPRDGFIYGVAGPLAERELLEIAQSIR